MHTTRQTGRKNRRAVKRAKPKCKRNEKRQASIILAKNATERPTHSSHTLSNTLYLDVSTKFANTWGQVFSWERMEADLEATVSGTGDRGDCAVYLAYLNMGSTPLKPTREYAESFVPMNLRPEEQAKYEINRQRKLAERAKQKNEERKRITCRDWVAGERAADLDGSECTYHHPESGQSDEGVEPVVVKQAKMRKAWR